MNVAVRPRAFSTSDCSDADPYLRDPATRRLLEFFETKTLETLKAEDRRETWYEDWLAYQAEHGLYASVMSPRRLSTREGEFDLLRYARFLEVFAYCSPSHGYSAQVSFLGLFAILMGTNEDLKREAIAALERGDLLAFGVSEEAHGSDLLAGEMRLGDAADGACVANGAKYYIGNANVAKLIAILAKDERSSDRSRRVPLAMFALRPRTSPGFSLGRKIRTLGVRSAHVGEFSVEDHAVAATDLIAEGRRAWDAVFGTVTLGKFFLGFGSIGICEHAFDEALVHMRKRILYGKPVTAMPHLRSRILEAWTRLSAMKLYAYRTLDYVRSASADDRRYQLFCAVQKARVSTEGVKVMSLLSECVGAWGFQSKTYFETALRDAQLIPGLEGSMHINLGQAARFWPRYFGRFETDLASPGFGTGGENEYLFGARTGSISAVGFRPYCRAFSPLRTLPNVRLFVRQVRCLRRFLQAADIDLSDMEASQHVGRCLATVVYAQLVAESVQAMRTEPELASLIFRVLVEDMNAAALAFAALPSLSDPLRARLHETVVIPRSRPSDHAAIVQSLGL